MTEDAHIGVSWQLGPRESFHERPFVRKSPDRVLEIGMQLEL